jgi:hypothetical protein
MKRMIFRGRTIRPHSAKCAGASWTKSSLSGGSGNCVEVANLPGGLIGVRHSMNVQGPVLQFTPSEWQAFLDGVRKGEFDKFSAYGTQ